MIFVSLFSGAGGLDQGFVDAGWHSAFMVDSWKPAVDTLVRNHPTGKVYSWDLSQASASWVDAGLDTAGFRANKISCVMGGPPCQAFSRLNQNQLFQDGIETEGNLNDPRRSLFMDFLKVVKRIKPPFVVMENVPDLRTRKLGGNGPDGHMLIKDVILREFDSTGYEVVAGVLRAQDYGVPQMRRRMIFLGVRKDLGISPSLPSNQPLATSVAMEFAKILPEHPNQDRKQHSAGWIEKVKHIPQGGYYNHLPLEYKVLKPVKVGIGDGCEPVLAINQEDEMAHLAQRYCLKAVDGTYHHGDVPLGLTDNAEYFKVMPRMGTYLRRIREDVSHTVTRNPLIHPTENREITVREKAVIQTFPPGYEFMGTLQEQHVLVGNAVPCNLGKYIAEHIVKLGRLCGCLR